MRAIAMASALLAAVALGACGGGGATKSTATGSSKVATTSDHSPVTITLWNGFTNRELGVVQQAVDAFHQSHPWITVKVVGGVNDDKIIAAIRGGNSPDVAQSFTADNTGLFCSSGGWIDLKPYMDAAKIDASLFPQAVQTYTQYKGKRCSLPMLADTYGLYYNKALFRKAGITAPPKTMSELTADAKKLTVPDGDSFKVVGFDPAQGFYENAPDALRPRVRRAVGRRQRQVGHRPAAGLGRVHEVAEGPHRLLRLRQAQALAGGRRRGVLGLQRVRARQAGDGHRRRVPHRVHQGRAPRPRLRHRAPADGRQPARPLRRRLRHGQHRRHPQGLEAQGRRLGACASTWRPTSMRWRCCPTASQRADHHVLAEVERADARPEVQGVPRHLRPPEDRDDADHGGGQRQPGPLPELRRQVAGRQGRRICRAAWPQVDKQIDAQLAQSSGTQVP